MPSPISNEVRRLIVRAREKGYSVKEIIEVFDVKKTAVYDLYKRLDETRALKNPRYFALGIFRCIFMLLIKE